MSMATSPAPTGQPDATPLPPNVTHSHKSYRRKYRKIMVKFERQMRESSTLFRDQQRLYDISQRIAEQNDQIMSLLLELNSHPQVPPRLRYDLRDSQEIQSNENKYEDPSKAAMELRLARHKVFKGDLPQSEYELLEQSLLETSDFAPQKSYLKLLSHEPLEQGNISEMDASGSLAGGFLSTKAEEQYLRSLDLFCDRQNPHPRSHALSNLGARQTEKSVEKEREFQLKNPVSVYNWLRKNQPQVFLQDADHDKTKAPPAARKSKRESMVKGTKTEPDMYDEDGIALEPSTGRGKRKRDEDGGYRPKGGHARPIKRSKKDDGGRRSKRASMDISGI